MAAGDIDVRFNYGTGFNDGVDSLIETSDGGYLMGGQFTTYTGTSANRIIKLNNDGSVDSSFNTGTGFNNKVQYIIETSDGGFLIIGNFSSYNGTAASRIIKLNPDGTVDTSFVYGSGLNGVPYECIECTDGDYLIAGGFTTYKGIAASRLVKVDTGGTINGSFNYGTGFDNTAYTLAEDSVTGSYIFGGSFSSYSGSSASKIISLNTNGTINTSFNSGTGFDSIQVEDIIVTSDVGYLVGGRFNNYNGTSANGIIKLNINGTKDTSFNYGTGFDTNAYSLLESSDNKYLIGGGFSTYKGGTANGIIRLNTNGNKDTSFDYGTGFGVTKSIYGLEETTVGGYLAGGYFTSYDSTSANRIVKLENIAYAPATNLTGTTNYDLNRITITWDNNTTNANGIRVWRSKDGAAFVLLDTVPSGDTSYIDNILDNYKTYTYYIETFRTDDPTFVVESSEFEIEYNNLSEIPEPWCSLDTPYLTTDSTCGNSDGLISIGNYIIYSQYYSFTLIDSFNNSYTENTNGEFTGLTSGYYFLEAIPITGYLRDTCTFQWIQVADSNTDIEVTGETITDAICGSFNQQTGRLILELSGATEPYDYYVWKANGDLQTSGSTSNPLVIEDIFGGNYYVLIDDGTCILLYQFTIHEQKIYSVPNIKEIYCAEWTSDLDWNYWSTANDPDYYGGLDTLKFQSTKIAEYTNTGLTWYYIPVDAKNVSFNQSLNKVRQGFIFHDELTIAFSVYDQSHWETLSTVLSKKYVIVFKDNNDQYWTFGYRHGADTSSYTFGTDDAGLKFTFSAVSENKIITAISDEYVETYIK